MDYDFVFKCAWKQVDLEFNQLFTKSNTIGITRGHNFRILRKKSFTSQNLVDQGEHAPCSGYSTDNLLMNSSTKTTDGSQHIRAFSRLC
ncbi:hypothetical protein Y032_0020g96 [Ancylostoma ceylanicum]|nr:hypothetical protein Y032_0020g96 [Ancylostoma ceylanicum]